MRLVLTCIGRYPIGVMEQTMPIGRLPDQAPISIIFASDLPQARPMIGITGRMPTGWRRTERR